jgi:hypothetical protein
MEELIALHIFTYFCFVSLLHGRLSNPSMQNLSSLGSGVNLGPPENSVIHEAVFAPHGLSTGS